MLSVTEAVILGIIQGASELFPVSSLGHSVIAPQLLGWHVDQTDPFFLAFLVATHLATALVLLGFFYEDWLLIIFNWIRSLTDKVPTSAAAASYRVYARLGWLIIVATVPAGLLGLLLQKKISILFASPRLVAIILILNGLLLLGMEVYEKRRRTSIGNIDPTIGSGRAAIDGRVSRLTFGKTVCVGFAQCLALIPGFSRTGTALAGGLFAGLDREDAARFAFLLATPLILAAAVLKLPELFFSGERGVLGPLVTGFLAAGIAAYLSVRFLTKYFKTHTLKPFGVYCVVVGIAAFVVLLVH